MFSYLEKFRKLPKELQGIVSSPQATKIVAELEEKYGVELASLVIKIMVKEVSWDSLKSTLVNEQKMQSEQAVDLIKELEQKVFPQAIKYLKVKPAASTKPVNQSTTVSAPIPAPVMPQKQEKVDQDVIKAAEAVGVKQDQTEDIRRLTSILKTFKKGVRDELDTMSALQKNKEAGGLNLSQEQAKEIISISSGNKVKPQASPVPKNKPAFTSVEQIRDVEYDLSALEAKEESKKKKLAMTKKTNITNQVPLNEFTEEELQSVESPKSKVESTTTDDDETKGFVISPEKFKQAEKFFAEKVKEDDKKIPENKPSLNKATASAPPFAKAMEGKEKQQLNVRMQRPTVISNQNKPQVNDIVMPKKKLQGPVEELANLDLTNFRRLSNDAKEVAKKIKEKINLLEEESYTKRQQGVNAWRSSSVYKIYIEIGHESIKQGISIKDVIQKKEGNKEEILTIDEFNAIMDLNKALRV